MSNASAVVAVGECLASFRAEAPGPLAGARTFELFAAGAEANVAVGLARLGRRVAYVGVVGADGLGEGILRRLRAEGVDVQGTRIADDAATGVMIREQRGFGPSVVLYYRKGSAGSSLAPADVEAAAPAIRAARWLHLSGITPALSETSKEAAERACALAEEAGTDISFDVNYRERLWPSVEAAAEALAPFVARSDLVFAGTEELALFFPGVPSEEAARRLLALMRSSATLVGKLGRDGAMFVSADGATASALASPLAPVDPVGAGDAFAAGYLDGVLAGMSRLDCLRRGNTCAAFALSSAGDVEGSPSAGELRRAEEHPHQDVIR